jgi:hypothetical protein
MRFVFAVLLVIASVTTAAAQVPQRVRPPVLKNRNDIVAERQRIANRVLKRGDSLIIKVYAYVDEKGVTRHPEIKTSSGNAKADSAAMMLVRKMVWQPAQNAKRGVMLTIPVMLMRK